MQIEPRKKYVLVKPEETNNKETESGLILPSTEEAEQKSQGVVEAVGKEVDDIKKGDVVIYGTFAGEVVKRKNKKGIEEEWHLVLEEDIIAFLK